MNEIKIRSATAGDIGGLVESTAALFAEDGAARDQLRYPGWPHTHGARWCADLIADPTALVLVVVIGDEVCGHLIGTYSEASEMWTAPMAELVSMFVLPSWRGQALGSRLVENFVSWARDRGALRLKVSAYTANDGAVRFYRRHGFAPLACELVVDL